MRWVVEEIIQVGRMLHREGLVSARAGNISRAFGDRLFITRTGSFVGSLSPKDIIELPLEGDSPLEERASTELRVHRAILLSTEGRAVVHAHPPHAVTLSFRLSTITPADSEGREILGEVRVIDSPKEVPFVLKSSGVVIVKGHGAFAVGKELKDAYALISTLEHSCRILYSLWR